MLGARGAVEVGVAEGAVAGEGPGLPSCPESQVLLIPKGLAGPFPSDSSRGPLCSCLEGRWDSWPDSGPHCSPKGFPLTRVPSPQHLQPQSSSSPASPPLFSRLRCAPWPYLIGRTAVPVP